LWLNLILLPITTMEQINVETTKNEAMQVLLHPHQEVIVITENEILKALEE